MAPQTPLSSPFRSLWHQPRHHRPHFQAPSGTCGTNHGATRLVSDSYTDLEIIISKLIIGLNKRDVETTESQEDKVTPSPSKQGMDNALLIDYKPITNHSCRLSSGPSTISGWFDRLTYQEILRCTQDYSRPFDKFRPGWPTSYPMISSNIIIANIAVTRLTKVALKRQKSTKCRFATTPGTSQTTKKHIMSFRNHVRCLANDKKAHNVVSQPRQVPRKRQNYPICCFSATLAVEVGRCGADAPKRT
jgi:hypothetical protein